ncbi:MAG: lysine--tRNA ligase [Candidatus Spechtbacterales bacterium]|nr:lysine--tRNA ligase [Candidatus Spechtbacterales bacterium]
MTKTLKEIIKNRLNKRKVLKERNDYPYPAKVKREQSLAEVLNSFTKLEKEEKLLEVAGRLMSRREHGKLTFGELYDGTATMQIVFREDSMGKAAYERIGEFVDVGDFLSVEGTAFKTKRGEESIGVRKFKVITKSLRPLPEKWHGLKDVEQRYRKRYLDILMNEEARELFKKRSAVVSECRNFLEGENFIEVETPMLQMIPGGASAKPFETHLNALDLDMYLRIAPELYLKRLLVAGMPKVYELGRNFRNEGVDYSHNPEFTMLEFYWAYADYKEGMKLTEELIASVVKKVNGKSKIEYGGEEINIKTPFERIEFNELLQKHADINYDDYDMKTLKKKAKELGVEIKKKVHSKAEVADMIYKKYCLPKIQEPTFVIHHPSEMIPLAKPLEDRPGYAASIQLVIAGWELVKGYSELNDPVVQREFFEKQEKLRKSGDDEAQFMDEDFLEALEYGMPPAFGFGMGIDRLTAFLTGSNALREAILFPTMKPK